MNKYLKMLLIIYPIMMIFTYGHAAIYFSREAAYDCQRKHLEDKTATCYTHDLDFRPEAIVFTAIWPYYWSERLWQHESGI